MRKLAVGVAVLWLALWVGPAGAALKVVSKSHPVTGIYGYDGVWRPALASTGSVVNTVLLGGSAGDTIYVTPGTYDEQVDVGSWKDGNVVTGIRAVNVGGATPGVDNRWKAEIARTAASNYVVECPLGNGSDGATEVDGCRMEYMRIEGANGAADRYGIDVNGAYDFRFYECRIEGNLSYVFIGGSGESAVRCKAFYVDACSLGATPLANVSVYPIAITANPGAWGADGLHIINSTLDFSATTVASGNTFMRIEATLNSEIRNNTIIWGSAAAGLGAGGMTIRSYTTGPSITDSLLIADNSISGGTNLTKGGLGGFGNIMVGNDANNAGAVSDGVTIARNTISIPYEDPTTGSRNFGIKVEPRYAGAVTSDNTFADRIIIHDNVVINGYVGIGLHENARHSHVVNNYIEFPDTTNTECYGIVLEDARRCVVSDNVVIGYNHGIGTSSGSVGWENFGNTVTGNWIEGAGNAIYINAAATDTMGHWGGNKAFRCASWAKIGATHRTLAYWKGTYTPALLGTTMYAGAAMTFNWQWPHGLGDAWFEDDPGSYKASRGVPYGTFRTMGASGIGIQP